MMKHENGENVFQEMKKKKEKRETETDTVENVSNIKIPAATNKTDNKSHV